MISIFLLLILFSVSTISYSFDQFAAITESNINHENLIKNLKEHGFVMVAKGSPCSKLKTELNRQPPHGFDGLQKCSKYFFNSKLKQDNKSRDKAILNFSLVIYEFNDIIKAQNSYEKLFLSADKDIGLTYAWDNVLLNNQYVYWIHSGCHVSEKNWNNILSLLSKFIYDDSTTKQPIGFECRCGFGCIKFNKTLNLIKHKLLHAPKG